MGNKDNGRFGACPNREQLVVHAFAGDFVERTKRLVHKQDGWLERQRPRNRHPLLHTARELPRVVFGELAEFDQGQHIGCSLFAFGFVDFEHF